MCTCVDVGGRRGRDRGKEGEGEGEGGKDWMKQYTASVVAGHILQGSHRVFKFHVS